MKAYWFAPADEKLAHGDKRSVSVGVTHTIDGELELCKHGLHASERAIDALRYSCSPILYGVELSGELLRDGDKLFANKRTYLWRLDCEELLRTFARQQALINIEKIKPHCSDYDYRLILQWLNTGDKAIQLAASSAASSAAWSAAWSTAWSAARSAAWSAASSAAWSAAWSAASSAARSAAWSAAWSAASSAAWSAANDMLETMVEEARDA